MERERGGRPRYPGVLTPAEQRVLEELRNGGSNAEIAARLGISRETVKTHIASMLSKLGLSNRHELAGWQPEPPRRGARGWLGLLVRPAFGLGAATGILAVIVIFAVVIGASRDDAESIDVPLAETESEVLSCSSGVAVTSPGANAELVADCEALLGLRDTIRGTATLDWTGSRAMSNWIGVTVSGTPQRVTSLNLSGFGLDGELSGLLGNLTGLTTLDLSGNPLTGMLPSKLALLTSLTSVSLSGTDFEGCAPEELGDVATSDVTLDDCGEPREVDNTPDNLDQVLGPGTYRVPGGPDHPPLIFDIPAGTQLVFFGIWFGARDPSLGPVGGPIGVILRNPDNTAAIGLDVMLAKEWSRRTNTTESREAFSEVFDRIIESLWLDTSE